jgi:CRISPR-associated protein Cas2
MSRLWMIAYDISDDRVRCRVRNILRNYGARVQYSVFECVLDASERRQLHGLLREQLASGDSLRWYPLCSWCREKTIIQGRGGPAEFPDYHLL